MKPLVSIVVLALIVIGGYWFLQQGGTQGSSMAADETMGTYAYVCDDGSEFSMEPASDLSSVRITPGLGATFSAMTLVAKEFSAGARFEAGGTIFTGAGEEVQLSDGNTIHVCNPKPSTEMAPWNWGDTGEGGGMQPDVRVVVSESIQGKWQSTDDAKFVREFKAGGLVVDWYNSEEQSTGTYTVFTKEYPVEVAFPLMADRAYLQLTMQGTQADKLNFSVNKLTPEDLELTYMDRGGVLRFKSVQ